MIPSISMSVPVSRISLDGGTLNPPDSVSVAGWWRQGARPSTGSGTVVLVGHAKRSGGGVFNRLYDVEPGSYIAVTTRAKTYRYQVTRTKSYSKYALPRHAEEVFGQGGSPRLVVVTCSNWDGSSWLSNYVVFAKPV